MPCSSTSPRPWPATAGCGWRSTPSHGLVLASNDRPVLEEVLRAKKIAGHARRTDRRRHGRGPRLRARQPQAGPAQAGVAGRGLRRLRRRRGPRDRARRDRLAPARLPARGGRVVLARRLRRRCPPLWRRQDDRRRGRDGPRRCHHADPGHQHGLRAAVEGRADAAYVADGGRDRRVLRRRQGGPTGHHRDVPGHDHAPEGRLLPPRAARRPRLGPDHLRRGPPAAGPDLPDDRQPPGAAPDRADRHAGARGRPRGRRVLADRARSGTTRRGRTSRRRAGSRPPTASRCA